MQRNSRTAHAVVPQLAGRRASGQGGNQDASAQYYTQASKFRTMAGRIDSCPGQGFQLRISFERHSTLLASLLATCKTQPRQASKGDSHLSTARWVNRYVATVGQASERTKPPASSTCTLACMKVNMKARRTSSEQQQAAPPYAHQPSPVHNPCRTARLPAHLHPSAVLQLRIGLPILVPTRLHPPVRSQPLAHALPPHPPPSQLFSHG